jgi:succinyl-CoA synthetase beta subunit
MKLFEFQAKELFQAVGIPTPKGYVLESADDIGTAIEKTGLPCIVKAQVLTGGRGKAGLIRKADTRAQLESHVQDLFDPTRKIKRLLIEEAIDIDREIYLSLTVDPVKAKLIFLACAEGGVDIEELAAKHPEKIITRSVDIDQGLMDYQITNLLFDLGIVGDIAKQARSVISGLYKTFRAHDAELAEINPLFITKQGALVAGDGKFIIDDNSLMRQPKFQLAREYFDSCIEFEAATEGIPYLQFDGDIGLLCAGAGLTTTVYDLINDAGGKVANYLEFGGANYKRAMKAMELCLKNNLKVILVVTFGTIARADVMAQGLVEAIQALKPTVPIVPCIRGTNEEEATRILKEAGLEPLFDTEEAVLKAVAIAAGRSK